MVFGPLRGGALVVRCRDGWWFVVGGLWLVVRGSWFGWDPATHPGNPSGPSHQTTNHQTTKPFVGEEPQMAQMGEGWSFVVRPSSFVGEEPQMGEGGC